MELFRWPTKIHVQISEGEKEYLCTDVSQEIGVHDMFILCDLSFIYRVYIEMFVITGDFAFFFQCAIYKLIGLLLQIYLLKFK